MELTNDVNLSIAQMAPLLRRQEISPVELTEAILQRVSRLQPILNAFITVTPQLARRQARQAEKEIHRGDYRGPLHGIPITLKDLYYTAGIRTTAGSKILRNFHPPENGTVVDRLLKAGAILLGKTNLHEFAYGATNVNPHYGPARNPWDLNRIPGGSSGGSAAAVIAGLGLASMGTDTGGSIRVPASACGIVGLKPSQGLVPLQGVIPLSFSLDHAGPLCRSVEDAAILLKAIAGYDPRDPQSLDVKAGVSLKALRLGIRRLRVGIPRQYFFDRIQSDVRQSVTAALKTLEDLGARICEVPLALMNETAFLAGEITVAEAVSYHWKWLHERMKDYGEDLKERMEHGSKQLTQTYFLAQKGRQIYSEHFRAVLEKVDVLAVPTLPIVPPRIGESEVKIGRFVENIRSALLRFTRPANLTGFPAISIPCGFSSEKLPIGLQLIGRFLEDETVLRVAYAYEQATPWHTKYPDDQGLVRFTPPKKDFRPAVKGRGRTVLL